MGVMRADGMGPMGIFGGTFDPVHNGHLRTAVEMREALRLAEVRFLPAGNPPHREHTQATAEVRLALVRAAVADEPGFSVDDRETRRSGLSYSVDTLAELRAEFPQRSICLLLGMDAFLGLPNWHRWRELLELAHVVVAHRPGWKAPTQGPLGEVMVDRGTGSVRDLHDATAGRIFVHAVTQLEISSTELRQLISRGRDPRYLVPDSVCKLLREKGWYAGRQ
jgi:nicotinate-nucleotide adenylyltransferase